MKIKHYINIIPTWVWHLLATLAIVAMGFVVGRYTINEKTKVVTKYIELPPVHDTITVTNTDIVKEYRYLPSDTVYKYIEGEGITPQGIDTAAIIKSYLTVRNYEKTLFDVDTIGRCDITATVAANELKGIGYTFYPIQKQTEITKYKTKKFQPFVGAGFNSGKFANVQGGMFINHLGVSYQFTTNFDGKNYHGGNLLWKF